MRDIELNFDEVKRYAGIRGDLTPQLSALITRAIKDTKTFIEPRYMFKRSEIEIADKCVIMGDLRFESADLARLLYGKTEAVLMCATIGHMIDKAIERYSIIEPSYALILDAAATTAIESVCDTAEREILGDTACHTGRFSAGYGDLSINYQKEIINYLNATRLLGVSVSSSMLLSPMKSVTAFIGVDNRSCENCSQKDCTLRR